MASASGLGIIARITGAAIAAEARIASGDERGPAQIAPTVPPADLAPASPSPFSPTPAEALLGLRAPHLLDPSQAKLGLMSTDEVRIAIGPSHATASSQAPAATTQAAGRTPAHASTTKTVVAPDDGALKTAAAGRKEDFAAFVAKLTERLRDTPAILAPPASAGRAEALERQTAAASALVVAALNDAGGFAPSLQPERAGVVASFILNAAMIPGWPQPIAPQQAAIETIEQPSAILQEASEAELLEYVAALGGDEVLVARLIKSYDDSDQRRRLLRAAILLATVVGAFVTALRTEIEDLMVDFGLMESGETPVAFGGRRRLPL